MKYTIFIIPPEDIKKKIRGISQKIGTQIYNREFHNIFYRVKSKKQDTNPRKIFIQGDGQIFDFEIEPHYTLIEPFKVNKLSGLIQKIERICKISQAFSLETISMGDHGEDHTLFIRLTDKAIDLHKKLFFAIHGTYPKKEHLPHISIIYDDSSEGNIRKAKKICGEDFHAKFFVNNIYLFSYNKLRFNLVKKFILKGY